MIPRFTLPRPLPRTLSTSDTRKLNTTRATQVHQASLWHEPEHEWKVSGACMTHRSIDLVQNNNSAIFVQFGEGTTNLPVSTSSPTNRFETPTDAHANPPKNSKKRKQPKFRPFW